MTGDKDILTAAGLGKDFATPTGTVTALSGIDHGVRRSELCCVIGPSGCGKSTYVRLLAGLDQPTRGRVLIDGRPVTGPGPERGMVFQGYSLFPWLDVLGNVMFGLLRQGATARRAESEARHWLDLVGLEDRARAWPHQLSGGMQQRVAIARALAAGPRVLLMDEPFSALDPQTRQHLQRHLLRIQAELGLTVVFITHDLDEAILLADRILVLAAHPGRVRTLLPVPLPRPARSVSCKFASRAVSPGSKPQITPVSTATPSEKIITGAFTRTPSIRGKMAGAIAMNKSTIHTASKTPSVPPASASTMPSVSERRTRRKRLAPKAMRTARSFS